MDEKKLLDQIRQSASDLTPPESLNPDAVEEFLRTRTRNRKNRRTLSAFYRLAGAAAVFILCAVSFFQVQKIQRYSSKLEQAATENAAADTINTAGLADAADNGDTAGLADTADNGDTAGHTNTADNGKVLSALPSAKNYEEIYQALYENFYYPDDVVYDTGSTVTSDYSAISGSAKIADAGGATAEIAAEDGMAVGINEDGATAEIAAEDMANGIVEGSATAEIAAEDMADGIVEDGATAEIAAEDMADGIVEDGAAAQMSAKDDTAAGAGNEYSTTNVQELGVDEADIVKTDGQYIYILRQNGSVTIVSARDPKSPEIIATIPPAESGLTSTEELYVDKDVLNVVASRTDTSLEQEGDVYYPSTTQQTVLYTYDISDRAKPELTGTVTQDGAYNTSRKNGSFLYLFTFYYPELEDTYEKSRIIPEINGAGLDASDFYLPKNLTSSAYLLISSVNTENPEEILDKKALVSGTSCFYVSTENIYIANETWGSQSTTTEIMKFHYENGIITGTAAGNVKGWLNNSFSLNEYGGHLRVVSTYYDDSYEEQNGLYILDESLDLAGSIEDLAEGETIRSARFFGDTGYFVTFRQTDPLFSVDLSDPASPEILGELKVTGFSSYLHFYGENLLLGMGYEADENTGVKLSMFDISDPANVTELHRITIPGVTWCPSIENYRSILIDPAKNVFGFFCNDRYLVFSYDEEQGFVSELVYDFMQDAIHSQPQASEEESDLPQAGTGSGEESDLPQAGTGSGEEIEIPSDSSYGIMPLIAPKEADGSILPDSWNTRGLYIGDTFYLAGDRSVISFDMTDGYRKLGMLTLSAS